MIDSTTGSSRGVDSPSKTDSARSGRNIEAILARRLARLRERREVFPPDFQHGCARLGEVYDVLGARWAEQAVFVEPIVDASGELVALTVAYFEDYFMTVEQAVLGEVENLEVWLAERLNERGRSVWLFVDGLRGVRPSSQAVVIECELGRLLELERTVLSVTRDIDPGDRDAFEASREAVLRDSRTNILSLIALSVRLTL